MQQQTAERHLTVPAFSVHVVGTKFVEIHFHDRVTPPQETKDYLREHGFRHYENCNGREEPRYGSRQSVEAWKFIRKFNDTYGHEFLPSDVVPEEYRVEPWAPVYATPIIPPPPEPMPTKTKTAPGQLDFMAMFEDIFAIANDAVAELDEQAQRRAKLLAEIERWKSWRASWIGGEYRWILSSSAIAMMLTASALAIYKEQGLLVGQMQQPSAIAAQPIEEDESLKKHEPLILPVIPPESTVEAEAHAETTTETHAEPIKDSEQATLILAGSSQEPQKLARKKKVPKVRTKFPKPKLAGEASWLDDDELIGTEQYIGCYAVLNGQVGLSFKGLAVPVTMRIDNQEYIAQPGTFQPLELESWMCDRLTGLINIWAAYSHLVSAEGDADLDEEEVEDRRELLNLAYDDFVVHHGYIHQNKGLTHFNGNTDTRLYMLMALEQEDSDNGGYVKASIFHSRQQYPSPPPTGQFYFDPDPVERCRLAFIKCLDERGLRFDLELTATLAGLEPEETEEYLLDLGLVYRDPVLEG